MPEKRAMRDPGVEITDLELPRVPGEEGPGRNGVPGSPPPLDDAPDPFDPASLRLTADLSAALGVNRVPLTVPVRRPSKEWFVRVHPDSTYHLPTAVLELKEQQEIYLVAPHLRPDLARESTFTVKLLFLAVNRQHTPFMWPLRLPGPDGRSDSWSSSALEAAQLAMRAWVRVIPDMTLGAYTVFQSDHGVEPVWPDLSMRDVLRVAFKAHYIDTLEHPVLRQLRGEV